MKKVLITLGILVILAILLIIVIALLLPWMDRWGTTSEERIASFTTDDLVPEPVLIANRGINIDSTPENIFPWILQIGADKSGMYSYTWLENLVGCKMARDETIRPEWQALQVGDLMKMCAGDFAPPPYIVAQIETDDSVTFGHKEGENWVESWNFSLIPQADGTTRLITRTRTMMATGFWQVLRPISFTMERKMLLTIKRLAEQSK
jgi:hypothetical protein